MSSRARRGWVQQLIVLLVPALVTWPRFWNGFVFDDVFVITQSDFIHQLRNLPRLLAAHTMVASSLDAAVGQPAMDTYRPLSIASFFWDAQLSGRAPWSYHLTNMVLHGIVCLLVLQTLRRLLRTESSLPLLLSLCFGLAPWLAEAHVWINGRSDLLLSAFTLSALLMQHRALVEQRLAPALLAAAFALGALLSKETAVCALPFVLCVPLEPRIGWRARARLGLPVALACGAYLLLRTRALHGLRTHQDMQQLGAALYHLPLLLVDGAYHLVLPSPFALRNLRDDYAAVPAWLWAASVLACVLLAALALHRWRTNPRFGWSLGFAALTLAPAIMISTELWPGFGRYLYLPAFGVCSAVGSLLVQLEQRHAQAARVRSVALHTVAAASAACLLDATLALRDEQTMYARALARAPTQAWTAGFLGLSRKREGHCDEAVPLLSAAARMAPSEPRYAVQLARCLVELGAREDARRVALEGRARFVGTRAEAGFLMAEALSVWSEQGALARPLLERCLQLDRQRLDCERSLQQLAALEQQEMRARP